MWRLCYYGKQHVTVFAYWKTNFWAYIIVGLRIITVWCGVNYLGSCEKVFSITYAVYA